MSTLRSASYALGVLAFAGICAIATWPGGPRLSALAAPVPRLLFVSDPGANEVAVFSLPDLVSKPTITVGLNRPHGLCSTPGGDIWVANTGTQQMLEYPRVGGPPIGTLTDKDGYPWACDVDHSNNLAYVNRTDTHKKRSGPGELEHGGLPSTNYKRMVEDHFVSWDPGNLYVDGLTKTGHFILAELPAGSTKMFTIKIVGGTIHSPGMVQWYAPGSYLAVGDRRCDIGGTRTTCVYHVSISGSTGTIIGKTTFEAYNGHLICDMAQGTIGASGEKYIAGGDDESACGYATSSVDRWPYPQPEGTPTNHSTFAHPFGTAISDK